MYTVTEVYNNIPFDPALRTAKGFSCHIKEADLLFDTGGDPAILSANLQTLGIDPARIRTLVLSHDHWDHVGGLQAVLGQNPDLTVCILDTFSEKTKTAAAEGGRTEIIEGWQELAPGLFSTGPCGDNPPEQALALRTERGYLIITGCAHPHISEIIGTVARHGQIMGAIGGFHSVSEEDLDALKKLAYLSPSHCTEGIETIREKNSGAFNQGGAGRQHQFS
ncbi:MBL fold metallo-hydrolase [Methanofollis aquaemaris]|uniref:MBL fold metallo-hydrolase n=1 Tax=Methanofollis aquaemaris TaxID=126734 RepID=A0A8A3S7D4_9EURY|nr:MBL fold metallo-hydrolase [Methanofollis aquaemaris]QSZ67769.1 MBL fold metallo-hydrolase [Methanofollis aquaemaris]